MPPRRHVSSDSDSDQISEREREKARIRVMLVRLGALSVVHFLAVFLLFI